MIKKTYLQNKKQTQIYREQTFADFCRLQAGSEGRGRKDCEFGTSRGKLLYTEWINNKVLLYSTGNYIQNLM